ncbi:MAG: hypothetical protein LBB44_01140 [Endomicrobium sp.]|jgi:putative addiction module killer protein|nr:hypothetical protein [Endomicrobium sp.]
MIPKYEILRTSFFVKWFDEQTRDVVREITDGVLNLRRGNFSNCKLLRSGVYELKIHYGKGIRIYYARNGETILILLYGGADKKQQAKDIEKAIKIKELLKGKI